MPLKSLDSHIKNFMLDLQVMLLAPVVKLVGTPHVVLLFCGFESHMYFGQILTRLLSGLANPSTIVGT